MKLLDQVRQLARVKHFSYRTEQCYVHWAERYIRFHGIKHPNTLGTAEVEQFLTHLAVEGSVAASTQNQALNAFMFLYREVLQREQVVAAFERVRRPARLWPALPVLAPAGPEPASSRPGLHRRS